tara:strand:+ start:3741 stop:4211 length:471 start_codon:yes stop_codon:yes gene_type:complete
MLMTHFIGTFECKADNKGRIMIPISLKKQLSLNIKDEFVIKRAVFNSCLELYPMNEWLLLMKKINSLNRFNKKNNDFIRRFTAGVKSINIDSLGRLLIPRDLISHAKIQKDIVLSSAVNILEIWDKELYEASIDAAAIDFGSLAEDVMGDKDNNVS